MRQGKLADARRELELAAKLKDEERNHQPAASADPDLRQ